MDRPIMLELRCKLANEKISLLRQAFRRYHICDERRTGFVETILASEKVVSSFLLVESKVGDHDLIRQSMRSMT